MIRPETIKNLLKNPDFLEFKKHLEGCLESLNTVAGLANLPNDQAGQEAKVRLKAAQTLITILQPLELPKEKQPLDIEKVVAAHKRAGLPT